MHPVHEARAHHEKHAHEHLKRSGYKRGGAIRESDEEQDKRMVRRAVHQHEQHDHKGEKETDLKLRKGGKVEGHKTKARHDRKYADGGHVKHHGSKSPGKINIVIATGGGASERQQAMQQGMQVGARLAAGAARPPMAAPAGPPPVPPRPPMAGPPGMAPGMGAPPMAGPPGLPPGGVPVRPPMKRGGRTRHNPTIEREAREEGESYAHEAAEHRRARGGRAEKRQYGGYTPMAMPARPMVGAAAPGVVQRAPMNRGGFALKDAGAGGAKGRMEKEKAYGHGGATHVKVRGHMRRKAGGRIERDCD